MNEKQFSTVLMLTLFDVSGKATIYSLQKTLDLAVQSASLTKNIKVICTEIKDSYNNTTNKIAVCLIDGERSSSFVVNTKLSLPENEKGLVGTYNYWTGMAEDVLNKYVKAIIDLGYRVSWN